MFVYPMIFSKFQVGKLLKVHMFSIVPVASFFVGDFAVCSKFICLQLKKPDNCLYYLVSFTPNYNSPLNKTSLMSVLINQLWTVTNFGYCSLHSLSKNTKNSNIEKINEVCWNFLFKDRSNACVKIFSL